jgi:RHS repeat-associated protein
VDARLKKIVDSAYGPVEFEHDAFGNLSGATYNDFHKLWRAPDVLGNLFRTPERLDRKYGPSGQLLESNSTQGLTRYEYDAEGNLVKKTITPPHSPEPTMVLGSGTELGSGPNADKIWLYEWNASGHLARVVRPDGQSVDFAYDALGRRVAKTFAGRTTRWVWDGNLPLHEWQEETGIILDVEPPPAYEMDARLAEVLQLLRDKTLSPLSPQGPPPRPSEQSPITWLFEPDSFAPLARLQGERRESIVCDHLGTPLAMFNDAGDQTWSLDLDIYGQPRMVEGERSLCPFRYPGQCEDSETGLYYNRFRYFDPEAGGYISQDPIRLEGGNPTLYGYVDDPSQLTDVFGLDTSSDAVALRNAMLGARMREPSYENQAHHIVASNDRRMRRVRAHMRRNGVLRNDPSNGVFLPRSSSTNQGSGRAIPHSRIHNNNARAEVSRRILACRNGDEIRRELASIRQEMLNGDTRYLSTKRQNEAKTKRKRGSKCKGK